LASFGSGRDVAACTMCGDAAQGNAIGIEAKSPKCVSRSEAGLEANSPDHRHWHIKNIYSIMAI